jgi:hypothetical protein
MPAGCDHARDVTDALQSVAGALEATIAAGTARVTLEKSAAWSQDLLRSERARAWWRRTLGRPVRLTGVVDLRGRRYVLDDPAGRVPKPATPLWLVDVLDGTVAAHDLPPIPRPDGGFSLDRRLRATVDLDAAAERRPELAMPPSRAWWRGRTLPVDVVVRNYDLLHEVAVTLAELRVVLTLDDHGVDVTRVFHNAQQSDAGD